MNALLAHIEGTTGAFVLVAFGLLGQFVLFLASGLLVVRAAQLDKRWGYWCFYLPILGPLAFSVAYWEKAKKPAQLFMLGIALTVVAIGIFFLRSWVTIDLCGPPNCIEAN
jgi:hypothetical protein